MSHNQIGAAGAEAMLKAVLAPPPSKSAKSFGPSGPGGPGRGLWLRIEWNQIPVDGLTALLEVERQRRGLRSDIPVKCAVVSRGHEQTLKFAGAQQMQTLSFLVPCFKRSSATGCSWTFGQTGSGIAQSRADTQVCR